jgi:hypothetical protein
MSDEAMYAYLATTFSKPELQHDFSAIKITGIGDVQDKLMDALQKRYEPSPISQTVHDSENGEKNNQSSNPEKL